MTATEYEQLKQELLNKTNSEKICLENFLLEIKDEISISCSIPVKIPDKNLINIINRATKWFYKHYEYAVEDGYFYVSRYAYELPQFKLDRSIVLPDSIFSVYNIHKVDYHIDMVNTFIFYNNQYINTSQNVFEDIVGYVIGEKYNSDRDAILVEKYVGFQFNHLTNKLTLTGQIPDNDIVLTVYKKIPNCALFKDEIFFRYVVALAQKNLAMILGMFAYNLPGNITINYDIIQSAGQEALDKIEEEIRSSEGTDYFFIA